MKMVYKAVVTSMVHLKFMVAFGDSINPSCKSSMINAAIVSNLNIIVEDNVIL